MKYTLKEKLQQLADCKFGEIPLFITKSGALCWDEPMREMALQALEHINKLERQEDRIMRSIRGYY